jgi:hypothetical protein
MDLALSVLMVGAVAMAGGAWPQRRQARRMNRQAWLMLVLAVVLLANALILGLP